MGRKPGPPSAFLTSRWVLWLIFLLGTTLRVRQYAIDRSLWLDESFVALNIIDRSLRRLLTTPVDFNQAVPPGFFAIEKLVTDVFGTSEYALRAFPFACGVAALPLFSRLAKRVVAPIAFAIALLLFAVSGPLVYYSSEVKPYAVDVFATLAIYSMAFAMAYTRLTFVQAMLFGVAGSILIQLSYAGIMVAGGTAAVILGMILLRRGVIAAKPTIVTLCLWGVGGIVFFASYVHNFRSYTGGSSSRIVEPSTWSDLRWYWSHLRQLAEAASLFHSSSSPIALLSVVAALLVVLGAYSVFSRCRSEFALLAAPVVVTLVAAALGKFPILQRTVLFITPLLFLFLANGVAVILRRIPSRATATAAAVVIVLLATDAASFGRAGPFSSVRVAEIKKSLADVADHWRHGDVLYIHYASQYAFGYYATCDCFELPQDKHPAAMWPVRRLPVGDPGVQFPRAFESETPRLIIGVDPYTLSRHFGSDIKRIRSHKRGWVLVTWTFSAKERTLIRDRLLAPLRDGGKETAYSPGEGSHLYLFRFHRRPLSDFPPPIQSSPPRTGA